MKKLDLLLIPLVMLGCNRENAFDLQGHRGARGMMPENTIPAFIYALEEGVRTLEMDLAVTKDNQLVVSHEPYISAEICLDSVGQEFGDSLQVQYNIYQMTYSQIRQFDCGLKDHVRFPEQQKIPVAKPRLEDVVDTVEAYLKAYELDPVAYNIEIKSHPKGDTLFHPVPKEYSDLVYAFVKEKLPLERVTVQSFDFRILQYFHEHYPEVNLALLIENGLPPETNMDSLGFKPDIYSPYYQLLSQESVKALQQQGIKVIPWTVNEMKAMKQVIEWGVDGLITDYPNRYNKLINE